MNQPLPSSPNNSEFSFFFPSFAKLAEFLIDHDVSPETAGYIVGKAVRDLWLGAASEASKVIGEEFFVEMENEEDINRRFELLVEKYKEATGVDMYDKLNQAAEAIVNEIMTAQEAGDDSESEQTLTPPMPALS